MPGVLELTEAGASRPMLLVVISWHDRCIPRNENPKKKNTDVCGRTWDLAEQLEGKDCKGNRWVLAIPRLLLLELLVEVLLTTDAGLAVTTVLALPDDADLLFGVALVPARGEVCRGGVGRVVTTFPPRPVVRELDLDLLVGGLDRLLLLDVTVRRREDAEGDGDSCFKIQLDCPVCCTE